MRSSNSFHPEFPVGISGFETPSPIDFICVFVKVPLIVDSMFVHILLFHSAFGLVRAETSFELEYANFISSLGMDLTSRLGLHIDSVEIHIMPFVVLFVLSLPHVE